MSGKAQIEEPENFILYQYTQMQKDRIVSKFKAKGGRMTRQRELVLDIILEGDCSCCKEIYYRAMQKDPEIGVATVYRMVNMLEEIGAISRKNMYKIDCSPQCRKENACTIEFDDDTTLELSGCKWNQVIQKGLIACGYMHGKEVRNIISNTCTEEKV